MRRTSYWRGLVCAATLAVGALGCGGSDVGPRETTEAFFEAVGNGDGAKACTYLSDELLLSEGRSRAACAKDLTFAPDDSDRDQYAGASANIVSVEEEDDSATVTMTDFEYDRIELTRADGEWRISQLAD
jgi:Domain of unknown function (DUF4878)